MDKKLGKRVTIYLVSVDWVRLVALVSLFQKENHAGRVTVSSVVAHAIRRLHGEKFDGGKE